MRWSSSGQPAWAPEAKQASKRGQVIEAADTPSQSEAPISPSLWYVAWGVVLACGRDFVTMSFL